MFGRYTNKTERVNCALRAGTSVQVIMGAFEAAEAKVTQEGLPIETGRQIWALAQAIIGTAMEETGIGTEPCENCLKKPPVDCPREVLIDPDTIDYTRLADTALRGFQEKLDNSVFGQAATQQPNI